MRNLLSQPSKKRMYLFKNADHLHNFLQPFRKNGRSIGFVPTMGALHQGHLSLVNQSLAENDITVSSIFVNPTQFNKKNDLDRYPRTPTIDVKKLAKVGNHVLFMPSQAEMYPQESDNTALAFDFKGLDQPMEGAYRPGHFQGVAQIVYLLLQLVRPTRLYMGQKDFQQVAIVRSLIEQTKLEVNLVMCPIIRAEDGLALSSRNVRLQPNSRLKAVALYQALSLAKKQIPQLGSLQTQKNAIAFLEAQAIQVDYFEIVDGYTLQTIDDFEKTDFVVACVAAYFDDIRLIDNMILKEI